MKATIKGIEVEGSPEELASLLKAYGMSETYIKRPYTKRRTYTRITQTNGIRAYYKRYNKLMEQGKTRKQALKLAKE